MIRILAYLFDLVLSVTLPSSMLNLPRAKNGLITPIIKNYECLNAPLYCFLCQMITVGYSSPPTPKEDLASVFANFPKDNLHIPPPALYRNTKQINP